MNDTKQAPLEPLTPQELERLLERDATKEALSARDWVRLEQTRKRTPDTLT